MRTSRTRVSFAGFMYRLAFLMMLLGLQACAPTFKRVTRPRPPITLSRVYVYSFLDVAADELGPQMIDEINRQLVAALEARGVAAELQAFKDAPITAELARMRTRGWDGKESEQIPVGRVIMQNAANERRFGAGYRLVIFPDETLEGGMGEDAYWFTWTLHEAETHRQVWYTWSRSEHTNLLGFDRKPSVRARRLVIGFVRQMSAAGLIK
jgi:hypothetical protein